MAKRRGGKKRKSSGKRRRRVSGLHPAVKDTIEGVIGAGAGAIAAVFVNQAIKTSFTTAPEWAAGAVAVVIGGAVPIFLKSPNPFVVGASLGMAGAGAIFATNATFLSLPGISGTPQMPAAPMVRKGYVNQTVAGRRNGRMMGNLSGGGKNVIAGIIDN